MRCTNCGDAKTCALCECERLRSEVSRLTETLRLTRDGADLLVKAEEERQAMEVKLREACGGSEPSEGHDYADEVIGLLRVTRSQRDTAWVEVAAVRKALVAAEGDDLSQVVVTICAQRDAAESEVRRLTGEVEAAQRWAKGWKMAARRRAERDRIARSLAAALAARSSPEG